MRRLWLAVMVLVLLLVACPGCTRPKDQTPVALPTPDEAAQLAEEFVSRRLAGDATGARALLTQQAQQAFDESDALRLDLTSSNPHVSGYFILPAVVQSKPDNPGVMVTVRLRETYTGQAYAGRWDERLHVTTVEGSPMIDSAQFSNRVEATGDDDRLTLLVGGQQQTLLTLDDLPAEFRPQGADPGVSFGPGKRGFGALAFSPEGERLAFSTWGVHGFCGITRLAGKELQGIDLYFEGSVTAITWSTMGTYLAVEVLGPSGWSRLRLYEFPGRTLVATPLDEQLPPDEYALAGPRWVSDGVLEFTAGVPEGTPGQPDKAGIWRLEVADGTLSTVR